MATLDPSSVTSSAVADDLRRSTVEELLVRDVEVREELENLLVVLDSEVLPADGLLTTSRVGDC